MAKYLFQNYRAITLENYTELPEVFQKEMQHIATFDTGYENKSIEGFMKVCFDEYPDDPEWSLYDVVASENPEKVLYHFWHYFDEYGSLFFADSGKDADIGMMNFRFELHNGSKESIQLAQDLEEAYFND